MIVDHAKGAVSDAEALTAPGLSIGLLGTFTLEVRGHSVPALSRAASSLLALLALRSPRPIEREQLAATLWPDSDESAARYNLRRTLTELRAAMGPEADRIVASTAQTLRLNLNPIESQSGVGRVALCDVLVFDAALRAKSDDERLEKALSHYAERGSLLPGERGEWVLAEREARAEAYLAARQRLAQQKSQCGDWVGAIEQLRSLLRTAPTRETAARDLMRALDQSGQSAAVVTAYQQLRDHLRAEADMAPDAETTALYKQLRVDSQRRSAANLDTASDSTTPARRTSADDLRRRGLPRPLSALIGRDRERMEVAALLNPDKPRTENRLVTLTGSGGVGKTRLAISVAEAVLSDYQDGSCFADLAPLGDPSGLLPLLAHAFHIPEAARQDDAGLLDHVLEALRPQQTLLLLDNCEHIADAVSRLTLTLLHQCPRLTILATSRQPLQVPGEVAWRVPGLDEGAAIRLFAARAEQASRTFPLNETTYPSVRQIVARLDGIPLAIEMTAARVRALSLAQIATRLDDVFRLLGSVPGGSLLPRHQTLRATLDWSYRLLSPPEQRLLTRLSVFSGGWTLAAAEAIGAAGDAGEEDVLDLLASLIDKSLVQFIVSEIGAGEGRYRMLETIRQYASEKLLQSHENESVRDLHIAFFVALAEEAQSNFDGPEQATWFDRLESERDNFRAALDACAAMAPTSSAAALSGLRLAAALGWFWAIRGYQREGRGHLDRALASRECAQRAARPQQERPAKEAVAMAIMFSGLLRSSQGEAAAAEKFYEECLVLCREIGHERGTYMTLMMLGNTAAGQGDDVRARAKLEEALTLQRKVGHKRDIALTLLNLGSVAARQGDGAAAKALYKESLDLNREFGDKRGIGVALHNLGRSAANRGDDAAARSFYEESLVVSREVGDKSNIAATLNDLAGIVSQQNESMAARTMYEECLCLYREIGYKRGVTDALNGLARVDVALGKFASARTFYAESLSLYRAIGNKRGIANALEGMASACVGDDRAYLAVVLWGAADALRDAISVPLSPKGQAAVDASAASARTALGEDVFAASWAQGRAVSWEQAAERALRE